MRHAKKRLQLNRFTSWHEATIRSLAKSLILSESIRTTLHRAKAARQTVEKLITLSKKNDLFSRRQAQKLLGEHKLVTLLFNELGPRFANRQSGFTRIISLGKRRGDNAEMVIFELTEIKKKEARPKRAKEAKEPAAPPSEEQAAEKGAEGKKEHEKQESKAAIKEKPVKEKKPQKKFLGGLKNIFKKERDSL